MIDYTRSYAITRHVNSSVPRAIEQVRAALADEGFGVLTEIDIKATMKKKLDKDYKPYFILGACNPGLADRALQAELPVGLLLPCNVVVYEGEDGQTWVQAIKPQSMFSVIDRDDIAPIADEVNARLERVLASLD